MKKSIKRFFTNFWSVIRRPEMTILPGQLAFFFVLAFVPIITFIGYGASVFHLSLDFIREFLEQAFSSDIASLIMPAASNSTSMNIAFFISLLVGGYIASNGADSIIVTSNTIYGVKNGNWVRRRIKALLMTFIIVVLFIFILLVPVFGDRIVDLIRDVNLNQTVTNNLVLIFSFLKSPIYWFILFMFIKILYTMAPDRKVPSARVNYGALFTTVGWIVATQLFSYWVGNFGSYDVLYGGLANIVIVMLWVYLLTYIFVIGMALNYREEELAKTGTIEIQKKDKTKE